SGVRQAEAGVRTLQHRGRRIRRELTRRQLIRPPPRFSADVGDPQLVRNHLISPLRVLPGPQPVELAWVWSLASGIRGRSMQRMADWHREYGPIVRLGRRQRAAAPLASGPTDRVAVRIAYDAVCRYKGQSVGTENNATS